MIARAIIQLLNVSDVTGLATSGVHYVTAPQKSSGPYIVFREIATPEHFKNGTKVIENSLELVIVSPKGKDGTEGFLMVETLGDIVHSKLDRVSGLIGGKSIQTIVQQSVDVYYDQISMTAIMEMSYLVRENVTAPIADGIGLYKIGTTFIVG